MVFQTDFYEAVFKIKQCTSLNRPIRRTSSGVALTASGSFS
jgi:hypothetical protein